MQKVSVILTSYNKPEYVGKAIEGILNQTYNDFELLIMDDNSDEETHEVIKRYLNDKRIRYFRSNIEKFSERAEKIRYAVLINKAIEMCQGKYITYATDDNVYKPERLKKMVDFLDKNPEKNIVYSSSMVIFLDEESNFKRTMHRQANSITWLASCQVDHCSVMHRADILPVIYKRWGSYWDEDPQFYFIGDARFFWRLCHYWSFYPLQEVLDDNYITEKSLHFQLMSQEKSPLLRLLPEQRTCTELREYLRCLRGGKYEKVKKRDLSE